MSRLILCALLLLAASLLHAATLGKLPAQYLMPKVKTPVVVDGNLAEWNMAAAPCLITSKPDNPLGIVYCNDATNPVKGDDDLSGRVSVAWDDTYFYAAAEIVDDHLMGVKPGSAGNQGPAPWACDSVMITLNSARQPMTRNSLTGTDPCLGLRYIIGPHGVPAGNDAALDKLGTFWMITAHGRWASVETERGYRVEAAIPWSDLGYTPRAGERVFMSVLVPDVDPNENLNQVGWGYGSTMNGWPVFRLADRADAVGLVTTSINDVRPDAAWSIRTEVDAYAGTVKVGKVRVVDARGKAVLDLPAKADVPAGMRGSQDIDIAAGALTKPGAYEVQALLANGTVLARVPLRVVAATPEPPAIANLPGEINHMRPARVTHNAHANHRRGVYRHDFVKSSVDYLPYITKYVAPPVKDAAKRALAGKDRWMFGQLPYCLSLYKATGDGEYVTLGRDLMDGILTVGKIDSFMIFDIAVYRALTWKTDPNSPFAPKDAEARYRALFYPIAANPDQAYFNEIGTHNRVWHNYALLKIARMVAQEDGKPVDPRVVTFTDLMDTLIGNVGDADDASSGYHWVWSPPALAIYFHTGDWKGFVLNPGYVKTFSRYVEMVSPSGGCPTFGSDGGWPQIGQTMLFFELLSSMTHNGRYRWASHRIAEYVYNHIYEDAGQYHGPFDMTRYNFALAYLFADDSVAPTPPAPTSRVTWRHPLDPAAPELKKANPGMTDRLMNPAKWIPDKLVLSGSNDARSFWVLMDLLPIAGHGGETPGNICAMLQQDSVLMGGQGYYEVTQPFQNLLWVEDLDGTPADPRPMTTDLPVYADDPTYTFARIATIAYQHLPMTYLRDVFFHKSGFMVLKDHANFEGAMKVRVGPCQQTRNLGPQCGENWFNTYYDELYWTGLGLGYGVQAFPNPAWDLLVYFSPRAGRTHTVKDAFLENVYRLSPVRLRQEWQGMTKPGQQLTFTTVLLPHAPTFTPKTLLEPTDPKEPTRIEILRDDDAVTLMKVVVETDPINKIRMTSWVLLNDTGALVTSDVLSSDAFLAVVDLDANGNIISQTMAGGATLRFRDKELSKSARKVKYGPLERPVGYK